jgi:hypothetical protein
MREVVTQVYTFDELNDNAKENARQWYRGIQCFDWSEEYIKSLKEALLFFDCKLKDYSIDWDCYSRSYFKWTTHLETDDLHGVRLFKFIQNNYSQYVCRYDKKQKPLLEGHCPFTGFCADEDFLDPIREFMKRPTEITFGDLIDSCVESLLMAGCNDCEFQQTDEVIDECICINGFEFTIDGDRY